MKVGRNGSGRHGRPGTGGRFGPFGGRFVPEALVPACEELEPEFRAAWADEGFRAELDGLLRRLRGAAHPGQRARRGCRPSSACGSLFKREDLAHTGSHKINNVLGQALLARRLGKTELVAETGAGQHGVAAATVAAHLGLGCTVYMGERDMARQELNVFRMELLGATVRPVCSGSRTLKDATSEALRHWVTTVDSTHYCIGSVLGPHPYPWLVREFQRVIGDEARAQCAARPGTPAVRAAGRGGGLRGRRVERRGDVRGFRGHPGPAGRRGGRGRGRHQPRASRRAARLPGPGAAGRARPGHRGRVGVGRAGLPRGRARARPPGRQRPGRVSHGDRRGGDRGRGGCAPGPRGSCAALESAHAVAWAARAARNGELAAGASVLITMSGRGDKDAATLKELTRGSR